MVIYTKLTVNGSTFTDIPSMSVDGNISDNNSVSKFQASFPNIAGEHKDDFGIGDEVTVFAEKDVTPATTQIFAGQVSDVKFDGRPGVDERIIIHGWDYSSALRDATVQPVVFNNLDAGSIVKAIMADNVSGITTTNVNINTKNIEHLAINHKNVYDSIRSLADQAQTFFYVDFDKDLHFEKKNAVSEGVTFDNTNVVRSVFKSNDDEFYNKVFVYGDRKLTGRQQAFTSDGAGSVFTLDNKPFNTEVLVGSPIATAVTQSGGVFNMLSTAPSGVDYLVDFDNRKIVFVSGTDIGDHLPSSGAMVSIIHDISTPIIKFGEDIASQAEYKKTVSKVIQDKSITDPTDAKDLVLATLKNSSSPKIEGQLNINGVASVTPGNTAVVNLPFQKINNQTYTIVEANYKFDKLSILKDEVLKVRVSNKVRDVTDIIKDMLLSIRQLQTGDIDPSDIISRLMPSTGSVGARVKEWSVSTWPIGSVMYVGSPAHPTNGWIGSPGSYFLTSGTKSFVVQVSGGEA